MVMRMKQLNTHILSSLSEMKKEIHPTCLQGNYRDSLGEFSNMSYMYGMFGAERVKILYTPKSELDHFSELYVNVAANFYFQLIFVFNKLGKKTN